MHPPPKGKQETPTSISGGGSFGASQDLLTGKRYGFIYELFVLEEFRGKGMARKLIEAGIEHLKQDGYSEVRLRVYAGNQAMKLYETFGFKHH
ncbi:GNAT family N-acetyltransferase, partial [Geminicoccaceae bacterium SYSU G07066]